MARPRKYIFYFFFKDAYKDGRNSFSKSDGCFIHGASGGGVCSAARAAASQARRDKGRAEQRGVQRGAEREPQDAPPETNISSDKVPRYGPEEARMLTFPPPPGLSWPRLHSAGW